MPAAVNRTLAGIARYANVRPGTWERDVMRSSTPELNKELNVVISSGDADNLLGKPLFDLAMDQWPQLRRLVDIGRRRYGALLVPWATFILHQSQHEY